MEVEKIDHIAIQVRDLKKAEKFFANLLGTVFREVGDIKEMDIRSIMDSMGIELVEPLTPDGVMTRLMEHRGEGLVCLSLKVPNLEEAVAEMKSRGIRLTHKFNIGPCKVALFHPKDTYGVFIELIEYEGERNPLFPSLGMKTQLLNPLD